MKLTIFFALFLLPAAAQMHTLSREQLIKYTQQNPFERFPDGRPKVPDALLEKLKAMSSEEVLSIVRKGYANQYADGFRLVNPSKNLVGRAMTLQLMPLRPDVGDVDQKEWREKHNGARLSHQTALDMLQKGDVFVADALAISTLAAWSAITSPTTSGRRRGPASSLTARFAI